MAETQQKRPREPESEIEQQEEPLMEMITKRHKNSYNQILSILDENTEEEDDQQETTQDLTDFFTALQQELSSGDHPSPELAGKPVHTVKQETGDGYGDGDGDVDKERVIRHLLEASDDELGIPNRVVAGAGAGGEDDILAGEEGGFPPVGLCDGLWDLEDEAANYYTLLHSQLIM